MNITIITGEPRKPIEEYKDIPIVKAYKWNRNLYKTDPLWTSTLEDDIRHSLWDFSCGHSMIRSIIEPTKEKGIFCYFTTLLHQKQFKEFLQELEKRNHVTEPDRIYWDINYGTVWCRAKTVHNYVRRQLDASLTELGYPH